MVGNITNITNTPERRPVDLYCPPTEPTEVDAFVMDVTATEADAEDPGEVNYLAETETEIVLVRQRWHRAQAPSGPVWTSRIGLKFDNGDYRSCWSAEFDGDRIDALTYWPAEDRWTSSPVARCVAISPEAARAWWIAAPPWMLDPGEPAETADA